MCEKNHCSRTPEDICTCMDWQNDDLIRTVTHLAENITDIDWELDYKDLADVQGHRLCLIGRCKKCGGRLCISQTPKIKVSPEQILSALDDSIGQAYSALKVNLQPEEYYDKFAEMFHEEDRPVVDKWVMHQRCYSPYLKGYKHSRPAYMIVHTSADADKGNFPDPEGLETFLCKDRAILRLRELVEMEKEEMTFPYDEELYREEYGDDFWEACCDNYAAGWFRAWLSGHDKVEPSDLLALKDYLWRLPADREKVESVLNRFCINPMQEKVNDVREMALDSQAGFEEACGDGSRADLARKAFIKLRGELVRLYQKQCELRTSAQSDSETALMDGLLNDLEDISRRAHEKTGFTYTPLSEIAALN